MFICKNKTNKEEMTAARAKGKVYNNTVSRWWH